MSEKAFDWIKIGIALVVQFVSVAWFFASLTTDIKINQNDIQRIDKEQQHRKRSVYAVEDLKRDIERLSDKVDMIYQRGYK